MHPETGKEPRTSRHGDACALQLLAAASPADVIATIVALVLILVDFTQSPSFTAGAIYAVLAYIYDYLEGLNQVPAVVNNVARLADVRARLAEA